jgi:hypothetical protein
MGYIVKTHTLPREFLKRKFIKNGVDWVETTPIFELAKRFETRHEAEFFMLAMKNLPFRYHVEETPENSKEA